LRTNAPDGFKTLVPVAIDENSNYHIASQIYEGLLRFDKDLQVIPAIARSWKLSEDQRVYTFHLRPDVFFQNDSCFEEGKGRRVNAEDIRYCFERLCTNSEDNRQFSLTFKERVVGAESFFSGRTKELEGLKIKNDSTIELTLQRQDPNFLNVLCMAGCFIYPPEAVNYYGQRLGQHAVGTGPFHLARFTPGQALTLIRNPNYWGRDEAGQVLPYLDSISWSAIRDRTVELKQFKDASLDLVYSVPASLLQQVFADTGQGTDFEIFSAPALSTHYYGFSFNESNPLKNGLVRRALNLAVDRQLIVKSILKEEGQAANHGIVPFNYAFATAGYQYALLKGYAYLPDSARQLLKLAGYGKGKKFPQLTLDVNDGNFGRNVLIALKVQRMLKDNLGIDLNLNVVPWQSHIENVEKGNSAFFRYAWVGDYPDPETFLSLFYSKNIPQEKPGRSYVNVSRFVNARFDSLFEAARLAPDVQQRMKLLSLAEQVVLTESAVMPLYYDENFRVVRKKFKNLEENAMNYLDFRSTYSLE
jgi:oligopeptide transport system substrate-binding protein